MTFPYTLHNDNSLAIIRPEIPLESRTSGELKSLTEQLLSKGVLSIIFDAEKTDYISSEGLHTLFTVHRNVSTAGGLLIVARPSREIRSLFEVLQLAEFMTIVSTMEEAMSIVAKKQQPPIVQNISETAAANESKEQSLSQTIEEQIPFESPIVVECESCGAFVRAGASGKYMCPSCNTEFSVSKDGTVIF